MYAQLCVLATLLPHNIELPDNTAGKLLFNSASHAQRKITRQEMQPRTLWWGDPTYLVCIPKSMLRRPAEAIGIRQ